MNALEDQWALVTGAGEGVGRAIALEIARQGASVALVGRVRADLDAAADACHEEGAPQALVFTADLSDGEQVEHAVDFILGLTDGIDILVNAAVRRHPGHALDGDPDVWDRVVRANLLAPMRLARRISPIMIARGGGTIVHLGYVDLLHEHSAAGLLAATSAGLRAWSLSCAKALRGQGVKVTVVRAQCVSDRGGPLAEALDGEEIGRAVLFAIASSPSCCPEEIVLRQVGA